MLFLIRQNEHGYTVQVDDTRASQQKIHLLLIIKMSILKIVRD